MSVNAKIGLNLRFALFIENEGFGPLLERAQIQERHDLAIFSSKGMSTTATRTLFEHLRYLHHKGHGLSVVRAEPLTAEQIDKLAKDKEN